MHLLASVQLGTLAGAVLLEEAFEQQNAAQMSFCLEVPTARGTFARKEPASAAPNASPSSNPLDLPHASHPQNRPMPGTFLGSHACPESSEPYFKAGRSLSGHDLHAGAGRLRVGSPACMDCPRAPETASDDTKPNPWNHTRAMPTWPWNLRNSWKTFRDLVGSILGVGHGLPFLLAQAEHVVCPCLLNLAAGGSQSHLPKRFPRFPWLNPLLKVRL